MFALTLANIDQQLRLQNLLLHSLVQSIKDLLQIVNPDSKLVFQETPK